MTWYANYKSVNSDNNPFADVDNYIVLSVDEGTIQPEC